MATRKARLAFNIKRFKGFLYALRRSKRGLFGVTILVVASIVAVSAPILTSNDPIATEKLAGNFAAPSWARYLPGGEQLSENVFPMTDPELKSPDVLKEFNITITPSYDVTIKAYCFSADEILEKKDLAIKVLMDDALNFTTETLGKLLTTPGRTFYDLIGSHSFRIVNVTDKNGHRFKLWNTGDSSPVLMVSSAGIFTAYFQASPPSPPSGKGSLSCSAVFNDKIVNASFSIVGKTGTYWTNVTGVPAELPNPVALDPGSYLINATYKNPTTQQYMTLIRAEVITAGQITTETLLFNGTSSLPAQNGTPSVENVFVQHAELGTPSSPGSIAIIYEVSPLPTNSSVTIRIAKDFYYPYSGVPGKVTLISKLLLARVEGVSIQSQLVLQQSWLTSMNVSRGLFSNNVTNFYFGKPHEGQPPPTGVPEIYTAANFTQGIRTLSWISPAPSLTWEASGPGLTVLKELFPRAGVYTFGIEVTITKVAANAEAILYIDNLDMKLQGRAFGILGTDSLGRDVYSQLVYGTRISLVVGLLAAVLSVVIGLLVGLVSAYLGGVVDEFLMRFTDALLVLPSLPLMIILMAVFSSNQYNMNTFIMVIGFLGWMGFARVVRSQVLSLKERPYVEAAKAVGAGTPYILARHILPNVMALVYVTLALSVPSAIVSEAALSFLGFIDLRIMSWGRMLYSTTSKPELWWLVIPPGLAIAVLSLSFILLGYALDEILNPKLRMRR